VDYFLLYFILRLDVLSKASTVLVIVTGIVFAITLLVIAISYNDEEAKNATKPWAISFGIASIVVLLLTVMIPSTKQAAVIYCLPKIVNNEQVQKIPDNLLKLTNSWINDQITETTETITETTEAVVKSVEN
jgi:hypothetical protein